MLHTSKETNPQQIEAARRQGDAQRYAVDTMRAETGGHAGQQRAGDYEIAYAVEDAEGLYRWHDGRLVWQNPADENAHIEIVVADAADGRFIPGLDVYVTIIDADGRDLGTHQQPLLWHPWLSHYGRNWTVPGDGTYTLRVHVGPLPLARHDKVNGGRFARPVDVEFTSVAIKTGQKKS